MDLKANFGSFFNFSDANSAKSLYFPVKLYEDFNSELAGNIIYFDIPAFPLISSPVVDK